MWTGAPGRKGSTKHWRKKARTHGCYLSVLLKEWASPLQFCYARDLFVEPDEIWDYYNNLVCDEDAYLKSQKLSRVVRGFAYGPEMQFQTSQSVIDRITQC